MKNKRWTSVFVILVFIFNFFVGFVHIKAADIYDDKGTKTNIDCNKNWTIKFNMELDESTVNTENVVVLDEKSNKVSVKVTLGNDKKSIVVTPNSYYATGKTYSLIIKDAVKTIWGNNLKKSAKMNFTIKSEEEVNSQYTVCIDAGHGGFDDGNVSAAGSKEKDINLAIALKTGKILKDNGVNVVYTRTSDSVSWNKNNELQGRFDISNNAKADYFVSLHCNTYTDTNVNGIETYYSDWDTTSQKIAKEVQNKIVSKTLRNDRGIKSALSNHEILRGTTAHAIMVELGFISNPLEGSIMDSSNFQQNSAEGIAEGILKSLNLIDKSKNITINSISNINNSITVGQPYSLPTNLQANMSDGSTKNVGVIWNVKSANTSIGGTYTFKGKVAGYAKEVILTLNVIGGSGGSNVICIDPGHGIGRDIGATGVGGLHEDDVTLNVGLKVGKILESNGVKVVYTRTKDERFNPLSVTESLQRRCDTSNNANAKYFVSIHCNSFESSGAYGTETLYFTDSQESKRLANAIQSNIIKEVGTTDRGLKDGNWLYVVNNTKATAVLTELGFLTNPGDAQKLTNNTYLDKYAKAIANGILQCLGK
ncbi:N-acetylmuramoyl-L-alanine amidase [Clostridium rectalis]|uniref:N-acetylmuramoyl-L-alanine amidase n=1 Tax=Clostridium rectalis TaxID=2040295 RepID=UPI001FA97F13|nr:N-acetylmuramoyl-L-alanine amidase [Clostridium rectalis]